MLRDVAGHPFSAVVLLGGSVPDVAVVKAEPGVNLRAEKRGRQSGSCLQSGMCQSQQKLNSAWDRP